MERGDGNSTIIPLIEGSGSSYATTLYRNLTDHFTSIPKKHVINNVKRGLENTRSWITFNATTFEMETQSSNPKDNMDSAALLQTNILLIAVLVVCFVTFASVVAMCSCFLRRYCKRRRTPQSSELYQTTLVSKATSITGLNAPHVYYSTKVEKKSDFSPNSITPNKCEKSIACELGSGRIVESCPSILSPTRPACQTQTEEAAPIYFKMKDILTSTPASEEPQHINDLNISQSVVSSPPPKLVVVSSAVSPPSLYTSAFSNQQLPSPNSEKFTRQIADQANNHIPVHYMTKGPLTQSVSWFVPLNGVQREPLRHSVVELNDEDVSFEISQHGSIQSQPHQQYGRAVKWKPLPYQGGITLKEELEDAELKSKIAFTCDLQLQDLDDQAMNSTAVAESVPLVSDTENKTGNPVQSLPSKRARLKSTLSDDHGSPEDDIYNGHKPRSRSLSSSDENSTWRQREDRPVLFLGSGIK